MKWIITGVTALLLSGCGWDVAEVVDYRTVDVGVPVVRTTTMMDAGYFYGPYGYWNSGFVDYGYNYDYGYSYPEVVDVSTTTVEVY